MISPTGSSDHREHKNNMRQNYFFFLSDGYSGKNPTSDHRATILIGCRVSLVNNYRQVGQWEPATFDLIKKKAEPKKVRQSRLRKVSPLNYFRIRTPQAGNLLSHSLISLSLFPRLVIIPSSPTRLLLSLFPRFTFTSSGVFVSWSPRLSSNPGAIIGT